MRSIRYVLDFEDGRRMEFPFEFDEEGFDIVQARREDLPAWTLLDFHRCEHCPLAAAALARCPLAASLVDVVEATSGLLSHETVRATVETTARTVTAAVPAQDALRSLMGLVIPASGCPHTAWFRPMARFHLPFSDHAETLYRAAAMYRLAQHLRESRGLEARPGLGGLSDIYARLNAVNLHLVERLRAVARKDSSLNAVVLLDVFAQLLPMQLDEPLEELRPLFEPYLV